MTEAAIRFAGALPDSVGAQVHLCEGLEGIIAAIGERMSRLETAVERQRRLTEQIDLLAFYLSSLASGRALAIDGFAAIAEVIERDVASGRPLEIISPEPISPAADAESAREWQARTAAMHSLTTAQVMARVLPNTRGIGETPLSSVIAALLLDVGMLRVPFEYVAQPGRLGPDQLRVIERHPILGAEIISSQMPTARAFCEVIRDHHERIDGTGYPAGTRIVGTIAQLVGAADHYSAMVAARPHRPPMDPHSAFMDLKLRQSRGSFGDAIIAGFDGLGVHPVGTGVVLANGCCGIVAASSSRGRQPVISLLISADGLLVPSPTTIEAGNEKSTTIVRSMPVTERSRRFGEHYPHLA